MTGDTPAPASRAQELRQQTADAIADLAEQLQAGKSAQLKAFLVAMSRFHSYSFGNIMLIVQQRPDASHVAGFRTWKTLGRSVKKGEKGIKILAPMKIGPKEDDQGGDEGEARPPPQLRFRVVHVFDIAQTDGEPLPEPARVGGDPGEALARLEGAVRGAGIELRNSDTLGTADGVSKGGLIEVKPGLAAAERFAVVAHEWAHEMLHKSPGDRPKSLSVRETEAEAVAFVVCRSIGLETRTATADYIHTYAGDAEMLAASLDRIQRAACMIIEAIRGRMAESERAGRLPTVVAALRRGGR